MYINTLQMLLHKENLALVSPKVKAISCGDKNSENLTRNVRVKGYSLGH